MAEGAAEGAPARGADPLDRIAGPSGSLAGLRVVVTGLGVSGFPAAAHLGERGAEVIAVDAAPESGLGESAREKDKILAILGVEIRRGPDAVVGLPRFEGGAPDLVVTSPGWRPDQPLLAEAAASGVPIWGDVELAWRIRGENPAPWLAVTGTNGKTTVTTMLEAMLRAAGLRALAAGNIGTPIIEAVLDDTLEVIAVELSSFQLHWSHSLSAHSAAVLNIAPDHIDWHGSLDEYRAAKAKIYHRAQVACVYNEADPQTRAMVEEADVVEGARAIGVTLGVPAPSQLGLVEDVLADRAFVPERRSSAAELGTLADVAHAGGGTAENVPGHQIFNALAAAALARSFGVPPGAVRDGLRSLTPGEHRIQTVAESGGVRWVNDSKATNPHAASASLAAFESIVWIAGGLAKGAEYDGLVAEFGPRLRAVVLIGAASDALAGALARHAPDVPVLEVGNTETGGAGTGDEGSPGTQAGGGASGTEARGEAVMRRAVALAAGVAERDDVVLLAPAAASMDQFDSYATRGALFARFAAQAGTGE